MEKIEDIISEELNDDSNTKDFDKENIIISLNKIERNKENRGKKKEKLFSDNIFKTNILLFIASIIFALYGIISILSHELIISNEEDSGYVMLSVCSIIITLMVVDSALGFIFGSFLRYKVYKATLTNAKGMTRKYTILFILELIVFLTITIIGFINMDKTLFLGIFVCPLIFGFVLFMAMAMLMKPKVND